MRRYIYLFVLCILCFELQTAIFCKLQLGGVSPNLLIMVIAASGMLYGRKLGMFSGVIGGILVDAMFSTVIGVSILIYTIIGYVNGIANKLYFKEDLYIPLLSIALSDFAYGILYYICRFMLRGRMDFLYYFVHIMLPEAIYTTIVGFFIYMLMRWVKEYFNPEERVALEEHAEKEKTV